MVIYSENKKKAKEDFNKRDEIWRIEAVIHDGNWYDFQKWKKVSRVKTEVLEKWIEENEGKLIKSAQGSYRVSHDEVVKWYKDKNIGLEEAIVPNNFPPKLWGKTTETDVFLNAPRRRVGTVSFVSEKKEILDKCTKILEGVAKVVPDEDGRFKAHGLSSAHIKNLLSKGLTEKEFNSLELKTRSVIMQRELIDLPQDWLEEALDFYTNTFAPTVLRSSMPTIQIYLPDRNDVHSQTMVWIISAMKKFDENASVPFSGYLSNVLRYWPYDLPDEHLGKELARFQREKKKAIDQAEKELLGTEGNVPNEVLAELMDMPLEEYVELNSQHINWLSEKNATTLIWEDSSNEKSGNLIFGIESTEQSDVKVLSKISIATVKAAVDTKEWESAFELISQIDCQDVDPKITSKLSSNFIESFSIHLDNLGSTID